LWPEFSWVAVTNGVHLPTWQDPEISRNSLNNEDLWWIHQKRKQDLANFVLQRAGYGYDPNRLVLVWARRFASYKRVQVLFENIDTLARILSDQNKPAQLLIAGKAHADDMAGKEILKEVIGYMQTKLSGHAIFVPNYDIAAAQMLTKGADVWINTPIQGQEACGTSGMKAICNGVLQLTVEDGWTAEVDWKDTGWTLDTNHLAESLYFRLEQDVIPLYYYRNARNVSEQWLERMKRSIELSKQYTTTRMLDAYQAKLYGE
jgi:starch phosphorylase